MRRKHYYKIVLTKYIYNEDDYLTFEGVKTIDKILFETKKRAEAEWFYYNHLYMETGTIYKDIYYPNQILTFVKIK